MPKVFIDKSIYINVKPAEVYPVISDFHHWLKWSPWLITEPDAKINMREDGKYYEWDGKVVGSGNMTVISERINESVEYDLTFLKPFKTKSKVGFKLVPDKEGTRVHWTMENKLPFFMFWMRKMMEIYIGMDYDRGLLMLKDYIEEGFVNSQLTIKGIQNYKGCNYIGIKTSCSLDSIGDAMKSDYERLMGYVMEYHKDLVSGDAFSIYHKWNPVKNHVEYTAAVPLSKIPEGLLEGMITGTVPATKVFAIHHKGPYKFAGNAWSAIYARQRGKIFKSNKRIDPMEVYLNSPKDTPESDLESEIWMAVKS